MIKHEKENDNVVAVVAFGKSDGLIKTVTSCDAQEAQKYAKYYRSVGYNARVMSYDELDEVQRKEDEMMMQAIAMECGEWRDED